VAAAADFSAARLASRESLSTCTDTCREDQQKQPDPHKQSYNNINRIAGDRLLGRGWPCILPSAGYALHHKACC